MTDDRPYHDIGGQDFGAVLTADTGEYQLWEKRVDAMMRMVSSPKFGLMKVDELRRGIETLGSEAYNSEPYYGKWARSLGAIMVEKGVVTEAEIAAKIAELKAERGLE